MDSQSIPPPSPLVLARARGGSERASRCRDVTISGAILRAGDHAGGKNTQNKQRVETRGLWMQITARSNIHQQDLQCSRRWLCWWWINNQS